MKINFFNEYKIKYSAVLPLSLCEINKKNLLLREGITDSGSVLLFLLPYYTGDGAGGNVSAYAAGRDYHAVFGEISADMILRFRALLPEAKFVSFADHSPINEKLAAASAGLGVIGRHSLLINPEYASFVFIGGIYADFSAEKWRELIADAFFPVECSVSYCDGCGECIRNCPGECISERGGIDPEKCLSAISQKKKLTASEEEALRTAPYVWGCDVCQLSCPMTKRAILSGTIETPIDAFRRDLVPFVTEEKIEELLLSGEFSDRAYSWRGPDVILRNLKLKKDIKT